MGRKVCPNDHWFYLHFRPFWPRRKHWGQGWCPLTKSTHCCATSNRFPWITRHFSNLTKDTLFDAKNFSSLHVRTLIALGTVTAFHSPHLEGDRWWVTGGRWWTIFPKTLFTQIWKEKLRNHATQCNLWKQSPLLVPHCKEHFAGYTWCVKSKWEM